MGGPDPRGEKERKASFKLGRIYTQYISAENSCG